MNSAIIEFNVWSINYTTFLETIKSQPNSTLAKILNGQLSIRKDKDGAIFIGRNGTYLE